MMPDFNLIKTFKNTHLQFISFLIINQSFKFVPPMRKKNSFFLFSDIFLLVSISLLFISCKSLDKYYNKNVKMAPYDVIIVPGVPFNNGNWDGIMRIRVLWSVYLYKEGITKNIIYSGSSVYSPFIEGKIMALYGEKLGVNPENIFVDSLAEHSTENVYYSYLIAQHKGFKKIALATDRFQSRTLLSFLRKMKRKTHTDIKCLPMQEDIVRAMPYENFVIDSMQAHVDNFVSIYDRQSFWKRFRGTLGKNIDYSKLPKSN